MRMKQSSDGDWGGVGAWVLLARVLSGGRLQEERLQLRPEG